MINPEYSYLEKKIISKVDRFKLSKGDDLELKKNFNNAVILITGASGSIGNSVVRKISAYNFKELILIDKDENQLTELNRELILLVKNKINKIKFICSDINLLNIQDFLLKNKVSHYLNFAAIKHVRSQEQLESIKYMFLTNSINFFPFSKNQKFGHLKQIFSVSTDKTVYPSSILGITKFLMEQKLAHFKIINKKIHTSSARFANVSFSNGSILKSIIDRVNSKKIFGIPDKIKRFFITHEESTSICLKSLLKKNDNKILIPNEKILKQSFLIKTLCSQILKIKGYQPSYSKKVKKIKKKLFPVILNKVLTHGQKKYEKFYDEDEILIEDKYDNSCLKINFKFKINPNKIVYDIYKLNNIDKIITLLKKNIKNFKNNKKVKHLSRSI